MGKDWYKPKHKWSYHWGHLWFPIFILLLVLIISFGFGGEIVDVVESNIGHGKTVTTIFLFAVFLLGVFMLIGACLKPYKEEENNACTHDSRALLSYRNARVKEYEILTNAIWNRSRDYLTLQSVLVSGSMVAVSIIAEKVQSQSANLLFARGVLFVALLLIVFSSIWSYTTDQVNKIQWSRINELECLLGIEEGNIGLYNKIKHKGWYRLRKKQWPFLLGSLFLFYLIALIFTYVPTQ